MGRKGTGVEVRSESIRLKFVWNGETIRERLTTGGVAWAPTAANEKRAIRLADEIRGHVERGTLTIERYADYFPDSERAKALVATKPSNTFGALADLWLQSKGKLSDASQDQYGTAVRFWKRMLGADTPVPSLTHKVIVAKIGRYPWRSWKQHNNYLIALRGVMDIEYRGRTAHDNPLVGIENMARVVKLPDPLTRAERDSILADMKLHYDIRVWAYFVFGFFTGMRPEEMIALRWSDIDWNRCVARVQRVRTFKGSESDETKTKIDRDVDLVPAAMQALTVMQSFTDREIERDGDEDTANDIFMNPVTGRHWHDERSQREHYWTPSLKRLKIRRRRAYCTRHTYCTVALMNSINPAYIAAQAGHSVKMLLDTYARWIPGGDGGVEKAKLAAAMGSVSSHDADSSQDRPTEALESAKSLIQKAKFGRRDWTRTKEKGTQGDR